MFSGVELTPGLEAIASWWSSVEVKQMTGEAVASLG